MNPTHFPFSTVSSDATDVLHQPIGQDMITELQSSWENYHHSKAGKFDVVLVCDAREKLEFGKRLSYDCVATFVPSTLGRNEQPIRKYVYSLYPKWETILITRKLKRILLKMTSKFASPPPVALEIPIVKCCCVWSERLINIHETLS